jgi:hypothetical protein
VPADIRVLDARGVEPPPEHGLRNVQVRGRRGTNGSVFDRRPFYLVPARCRQQRENEQAYRLTMSVADMPRARWSAMEHHSW